jgi:hypothetical protein
LFGAAIVSDWERCEEEIEEWIEVTIERNVDAMSDGLSIIIILLYQRSDFCNGKCYKVLKINLETFKKYKLSVKGWRFKSSKF